MLRKVFLLGFILTLLSSSGTWAMNNQNYVPINFDNDKRPPIQAFCAFVLSCVDKIEQGQFLSNNDTWLFDVYKKRILGLSKNERQELTDLKNTIDQSAQQQTVQNIQLELVKMSSMLETFLKKSKSLPDMGWREANFFDDFDELGKKYDDLKKQNENSESTSITKPTKPTNSTKIAPSPSNTYSSLAIRIASDLATAFMGIALGSYWTEKQMPKKQLLLASSACLATNLIDAKNKKDASGGCGRYCKSVMLEKGLMLGAGFVCKLGYDKFCCIKK